MEVSTQNTDELKAILTVKIDESDYREKVDNKLKEYRRKADIPGFRKGKVPTSLIKKQYGKALLIEEINQILQNAVLSHIREENLDILGSPIAVEQNDIDWEHQSTFSFDYELGLAPDFELKVNKRIKVPYHKITADESMVDRYVEDYAKRYGSMSSPEEVEEKCLLRGVFTEVDKKGNALENGITATATFDMASIDHSKTEKELLGKKVGDKLTLDTAKAFKKEFNLANLLGVDQEQLDNSSQQFEFQIEEISKIEPAELNQELFDKVFGEGEVTSEEEFRQRIREDAEKMFQPQSEQQFHRDVKKKLLDIMKFDLPEDFLKKWLVQNDQNEMTAEEVEEKFPELKDEMRWQLIENRVIRENDIQASNEEVLDYAQEMVMQQMAQYGQSPNEEQARELAQSVLGNKEQEEQITEQLYSKKLLNFFKENLKLDEKELSFDEFLKKTAEQ